MITKFSSTLRRAGYSVTPQRIAVFQALLENGPVSTRDLINRLEKLNPASVYRALALFRQLKVIDDVVIGGRRMVELTDQFDVHHHHHLTCTQCGRVLSIESGNLEKLLEAMALRHGFRAESHAVEISGVCRDCR